AAETTAAIDALVAEKAALVAELSNAQAKVAQSQGEAEEKRKELAAVDDRHAQRELELRESMQKAAVKEQEALVAQLNQLKQEMETLRAEHHVELESKFVAAVQSEKAKLVANLQAAQSQTYSLGAKVEQLEDELAKERKRVAAAEAAYEESLQWNDAEALNPDVVAKASNEIDWP
ncbi:hypothetical protein As57867_018875, partial [Aphanomyces stellatus]